MIVRAAAVAVCALFGATSVAQTIDANTDFLRKEPYKKQKQTVDLSALQSAAEVRVVENAIDSVMFFFNCISQVNIPDYRLATIATAQGAASLRLPPAFSERNRESPIRIYNWDVEGEATISVTVEFKGLQSKPKPYRDSFVFVRVGNDWKFDRHGNIARLDGVGFWRSIDTSGGRHSANNQL